MGIATLCYEDSISLLFNLYFHLERFFCDHRSIPHGQVCIRCQIKDFLFAEAAFPSVPWPWLCLCLNGPFFPFVCHFFRTVLVYGCQIIQFRTVCIQIIEFPRPIGSFGYQFPFSNPDCPVSFMLPINGIFTAQILSGEGRF